MPSPFRLQGFVAAPFTPFHADGSLDLSAVVRHAAWLLQNQIAAAFINGTTGECHSLTLAERQALALRWMEVTRGTSLQVIVHVGSNCLADSEILARQAEALGAHGIAALSPSYFKPRSVADLVACATRIAAAAPATPFYLYDIPGLTGVHLSMPEFMRQARDVIPNLVGLKYSNPDLLSYQLLVNAEAGRWDVPWGSDESMLAAWVLGARSFVGSTYNFAAPIYHRIVAAAGRNDWETARQEQLRSAQLVQVLSRYGYLGAAKVLMGHLGVPTGATRLPLANPTPDEERALLLDLERLDFFGWV
jgi:N-acetylneuraminate lyase